jgi:hypothetical protein
MDVLRRNKTMRTNRFTTPLLFLLILMGKEASRVDAATPGLPFTEDFSATNLRDASETTANWSTEEQAALLDFRHTQFGAFAPSITLGTDITTDASPTQSVALGDVDGDGNLDLIAVGFDAPNRLYLNNGTSNPWGGVVGSDIIADVRKTKSVALGDVDGDGDVDMVAGNIFDQPNRLYLNNGTSDPFNGVAGMDITADIGPTLSVALGDMDGDGDLDLVAGNQGINRLYLNNGTSNPWSGVVGTDITSDERNTNSVALGDMDGDGDLDVVVGVSSQPNRLYLNNGTSNPFNGVIGSNITADVATTFSVALGDVNGDGDLDVVVGNGLGSGPNRLYLNNGTSDPFNGVTGVDITTDADDTRSVALGDVDGDGDLDLVAGNLNQVRRLYLNNGTLDPFNGVSGSDITADIGHTLSVALGDVDHDGDLDLVAGNNDQRNRLYLNNSTSNPWTGVTGSEITTDTVFLNSLALGDMNGDGELDLVVGGFDEPSRLYLNNGTSNPWSGVAGSNITADVRKTQSVALGDVDRDGDLDMVTGNAGSKANRLYLNNGTSAPFNGVTGSNIADSTPFVKLAVALGDMDGDGDLDLVAGQAGSPIRLYLNNGTSNPWGGVTGTNITTDATSTVSVALGDVDRDGDLDVVAGKVNHPNRLYLNNGTSDPFNGVTGSDITADAMDTLSVVLGDVDGDGDLDVVAGNLDQRNRLYLNNGTSDPFAGAAGSDISTDADDTRSMALGDVDGDGDLDFVAGNFNQVNRLYLNNGTLDPFNSVTGSDITDDVNPTLSIALGDVDGDGYLDLVAGDNGDPKRLYLNSGSAKPVVGWDRTAITSDSNEIRSVALGDMDRDGDLDFITVNDNQPNRLYLNNGLLDPFDGVAGSDISSETGPARSVAVGDVNRDGALDIVVGNEGQENRLYLSDGTSTPFDNVRGLEISADMKNTLSVALGDVDGDGDLDVVAGNDGQRNRLYLNNGTSRPFNGVTGSDISADAQGTTSVAVGDLDNDGDLDVIAGNDAERNRLYLNNGTSIPFNHVTGTDITTDIRNTRSVALGDVNGDGALDVVVGNSNQANRLYLNNGTSNPFNGVTGRNITTDDDDTRSVALADVDQDGDLDVIAGNFHQTLRLYLNNGTSDPFNGVTGIDFVPKAADTLSVAVGDVNGDGCVDVVGGNPDFLYTRRLFDTGHGRATSLEVDTEVNNILSANLSVTESLPRNTSIDFWLSNNGGSRWFLARPGQEFTFPTPGSDLRWRAGLASLSPFLSPRLETLNLVAAVQSTPTPTATSTGTATRTPSLTSTPTNTTLVPPTPTRTPTPTGILATPTATQTGGTNYDVFPAPSGDSKVDARDLLEWLNRIHNGSETGDLILDFAKFWKKASRR